MCTQKWDTLFLPVHYRSLCLILANVSISTTGIQDIDQIIDSVWKRKDLLKLLFPKAPRLTRKHQIPSLFLQLVAADVIMITFSPGDKIIPIRLRTDANGLPVYSNIASLSGITLIL